MRTRSNKLHATRVGPALAAVALLFGACGGGSASPGVASGGSTMTSTKSASAGAGGGGEGAANPGSGAPGGGPGGGPQTVMVMSGSGADMLKYAECMRSHGVVDFPDPSSNGTISVAGTVSQSPQYPAADEACRNLLPNGGVPTAAQQAEGIAQLLKLSVCMRAHGIRDFPDPTSHGIQIPVRKGMPSDLGPDNPRFQSAEKACQHLAPS